MTPYYDHGGITIYHGDCREILPDVKADCLVTDPPWLGGGRRRSINELRGSNVARQHSSSVFMPGAVGEFRPKDIRACIEHVAADGVLLLGYKDLFAVAAECRVRGLMTWHKPGSPPGPYALRMDASPILWVTANGTKSALPNREAWTTSVFRYPPLKAGCMASRERILEITSTAAAHPCQAPIALMIDLMKPLHGTVLDAYMGTGTTLVAAKNLGRSAIGIEIEERYCEIAAQRLEQGVLPIYSQPVSEPKQQEMAM